MERKNTGQLSLVCTGNLRDNRQPRRLGSVLPSSNAIIQKVQSTPDNSNLQEKQKKFELLGVRVIEGKII